MNIAVVINNDWWWALKIIWTVSAGIGVILTGTLLGMAVTDYQLLVSRGINSWRQYVAKTSTLIFFGGFGTQLVYLIAGALGLTRPNPPRDAHIDWTNWFELGMFIFAIWMANILAVVIYYRRRKILEVIEGHLSKERESGYAEGYEAHQDATSDEPTH